MLRLIPIISFLVFSLWIQGLEAGKECICDLRFTFTKRHAYCTSTYPDETVCKCKWSRCSSPLVNTHYVRMSGCYLIGGDGSSGVSNQDCTRYEYDPLNVNYICHDGGQSYTCPGNLLTFGSKAMVCTDC
ncbi:uncharacterized protein MELLADRAFT_124133 [Melampsora larici-populina 98AG31]|uniref:Secreted protein n=1 Tax=Melampsora larici-populina (strain 98AG31 / pathotype 3-4-7) TaxID=747676 RepID=F4RI87_MELLP|nr:uncharacterized protein MELLADRAFT_124133 [Melampsora larici-populina 98AG31]EGG08007.1 secreted protein [Melampsora larici-populina 98AG31]